jgi:lipopolysaccharide/colanic/teichoic acid biosynthesis glycosyltransferase
VRTADIERWHDDTATWSRRASRLGARPRTIVILLIDLLGATSALLLAFGIESDLRSAARGLDFGSHLLPLYLLVAAGVFLVTGLPRRMWRFTGTDDLVAIGRATTFAVLALLAAGFLVDRLATMPRAVPLILWFTQAAMLIAPRLAYASLARREQRVAAGGRAREPVLLVGAGEACAVFLKAVARRPDLGLEVLGVLDDAPWSTGRTLSGVPILGRLDQLGSIVDRLAVHGRRPRKVLLTVPAQRLDPLRLVTLQRDADRRRLTVEPIPPLDRLLASPPAPAPRPRHATPGRRVAAARLLDIVVAAGMLVATAPLMALTALLILLRLGPPVLFRQERPGRDLRPFTLIKFRTMTDAISADGRVLPDELRLTGLGRFLRRTRLDELPQLWNVLRGEMSLVGPRPLLERDLDVLADQGAERMSVRPGITGWAQVCGGHQLATEVKDALDLWAIRHASLGLYLRILARTARTMLLGERVDRAAIADAFAGNPPERILRAPTLVGLADTPRKRRIVAVNRYYWPDPSATSRMLADLAEHLAADPDVQIEIITSRLRYVEGEAEYPSLDHKAGVRIHRIWTTAFGRGHLLGRAVDYLSFYPSAFVRLLLLLRPGDTVIAKTDPPLISVVAWLAARLRRAELVCWCQDLFPEVAQALGVRGIGELGGGLLRKLRNLSLRRARCVVINEAMAERLARQGIAPERIVVIHNWADGRQLFPLPPERIARLRAARGLGGARRVLMYSGNLGRAHAVPLLVEVLEGLRASEGLVVLIVGDGAGHAALRRAAAERGWTHLRFLPYQSDDTLNESLNVADIHLVSLDPCCEGLIMPSKLYAALAVGRPILAVGDPQGAVANLVRSFEVGHVAGELLADGTLARTIADPSAWPSQRQVRAVFETAFARERMLGAWGRTLFGEGHPACELGAATSSLAAHSA